MITVYTVILENHDHLRPPRVVIPEVEYICFSDDFHDCPPWKIWPAPHFRGGGYDSRIPKMLAHLFFDCEFTIYHDASLRMLVEPSYLVNEMADADVALYRHPCRRHVSEEMEVCRKEQIAFGPAMLEQVTRYQNHGINGLWAGGVVIRRNNADAVKRFNEIWWREFRNGCPRDQIALPWALQESGVNCKTIDADIMSDDLRFEMTWHAVWTEHKDNGLHEGNRIERVMRKKRIEERCG